MASACSVVMANDSSMMGVGEGGAGRSALHTRASTCILVTLSLVSALVLVVCGVLVVREWNISRTFEATECSVRNVTYIGQDRECLYCTSGAKDGKARIEKGSGGGHAGGGSTCTPAFFPCLNVIVSYGPNNASRRKAILYESSVHATGINRDCSFSVCHKSREENAKLVEEFAEKWRLKSASFRCFYDPSDVQRVIVRKNYTTVDVVHCMLWPSLVIVISITIFLKLESKRRGLTFCGRIEPEAEEGKAEKPAVPPQVESKSATTTTATTTGGRKNHGILKSNKTPEQVSLFDKFNENIPENPKSVVESTGEAKTFPVQAADKNHPTPRHQPHYLTGRLAHDQHRHGVQKPHKHPQKRGEDPTSKSLTNLDSICVRYVNPDKSGNKRDGYKQMTEKKKNIRSIDQINNDDDNDGYGRETNRDGVGEGGGEVGTGVGSGKAVDVVKRMSSESPLLRHQLKSSSVDWLDDSGPGKEPIRGK